MLDPVGMWQAAYNRHAVVVNVSRLVESLLEIGVRDVRLDTARVQRSLVDSIVNHWVMLVEVRLGERLSLAWRLTFERFEAAKKQKRREGDGDEDEFKTGINRERGPGWSLYNLLLVCSLPTFPRGSDDNPSSCTWCQGKGGRVSWWLGSITDNQNGRPRPSGAHAGWTVAQRERGYVGTRARTLCRSGTRR